MALSERARARQRAGSRGFIAGLRKKVGRSRFIEPQGEQQGPSQTAVPCVHLLRAGGFVARPGERATNIFPLRIDWGDSCGGSLRTLRPGPPRNETPFRATKSRWRNEITP